MQVMSNKQYLYSAYSVISCLYLALLLMYSIYTEREPVLLITVKLILLNSVKARSSCITFLLRAFTLLSNYLVLVKILSQHSIRVSSDTFARSQLTRVKPGTHYCFHGHSKMTPVFTACEVCTVKMAVKHFSVQETWSLCHVRSSYAEIKILGTYNTVGPSVPSKNVTGH